MTEHEQKDPGQRDAIRHARILEILLGAYLAATFAFGGWVAVKVTDNSARISVIEHRLDQIEIRLSNVEARLAKVEERLTRIEAALNILVARKKAEDDLADASKLGAEQGQLATR